MGITNTINRAEMAAITAAILHVHSHFAFDSLSFFHQIRKLLLHPELHCHHVQGFILKILMQIIRNSPKPVHLLKVNMQVLLVMSVQMLWPSIKHVAQPKSTQILQTQGCHALVLMVTLFMT